MENKIFQYLSQHLTLTDELKQAIQENAVIQSFPKGTILLQEGEQANHSYFLLKGCIRSYRSPGYEEQTLEFYTEGQIATPLTYGKEQASPHYLECIEEVYASIGTPEMEAKGFAEFPEFEYVCRIMSEVFMANHQEEFIEFRQATPEERYLHLQKNRPDLLQRAPQYQIASYLGMTAESLSRIRKRLAKQ